MVCFGRLVMELSLSFVPALLGALFSSLWCTQPYVPLSFLGSDVLMVVGFERCHCVVRRSCQCVRILRGLSPKLAFNRHTLESENIISILDPVCIWGTELFDNKAFDTEILSLLEMVQESLAGKARAVDWFFSSCCWEAKTIVSSAEVIQCRVIKLLEERAAMCIQNTLQLRLPEGFASPTGWWWHQEGRRRWQSGRTGWNLPA